ncbi:MAG: hypothetical protein ACREMB_20505 [Candidatus Rokuibacteriota bacterium]
MTDRSPLYRLGGASAMAGAVLGLVANLLHPRTRDILSTETQLRMAAESGFWILDHLAILLATLLITGGLVALARSVREPAAAAWARLGLAAALVSAALSSVLWALDGIVLREVALAWAAAAGGEKTALSAAAHVLRQTNLALLAVWTIVYFGITTMLYGAALARSAAYPGWLGRVALGAGLASLLVGLTLALTGPSHLVSNVLFAALSLLVTAWTFVAGLYLRRRATVSNPAAGPARIATT